MSSYTDWNFSKSL